MKKDLPNVRRGEIGKDPTDRARFDDPLEFIAEDHLRVRAACETIDRLAGTDPPPVSDIQEVIRFLEDAFPTLLLDEDDDLYILLRRRCDAEDEIEKTLVRLKDDHATAAAAIPDLLGALKRMEFETRAATVEERADLLKFASALRKHIIVENAIVLPLARFRLTEDDRANLRSHMILRRRADKKGS